MRNYIFLALFYAIKQSETGHKLNFKGSDWRD